MKLGHLSNCYFNCVILLITRRNKIQSSRDNCNPYSDLYDDRFFSLLLFYFLFIDIKTYKCRLHLLLPKTRTNNWKHSVSRFKGSALELINISSLSVPLFFSFFFSISNTVQPTTSSLTTYYSQKLDKKALQDIRF